MSTSMPIGKKAFWGILCQLATLWSCSNLFLVPAFSATAHDHLMSDALLPGANSPYAKYLYYSNRPSRKTTVEKFSDDNQLLYRATYTIDELRRRFNPYNEKNANADKQLLFIGCSVPFGEGLNDEQTIGAQISLLTHKVQTFNYGTSGYGPGHVLSYLRYLDLSKHFTNPQKVSLIFIWGDYLLDRANGSFFHLSWGASNTPYYKEESGHLHFAGSIAENFPYRTALAKYFFSLPTIGKMLTKYLGSRMAADYETQADVNLSLEIIREAFEEYRHKFHNDQFYVLFFPYNKFGLEKMRAPLIQSGVKIIDLTNEFMNTKNPNELFIQGDGHPSALGAHLIAKGIIRELSLK